MKVAIRVDASVSLGSGHVMRSLTLAKELENRGSTTIFVCRDQAGCLAELISSQGFETRLFPVTGSLSEENQRPCSSGHPRDLSVEYPWKADADWTQELLGSDKLDWLIVDHYSLDARWESAVGITCNKLMVIDDLANRPHQCDLLLDQNYYKDLENRYQGLVPDTCRLLLGPTYALLREEFKQIPKRRRDFNEPVSTILVFFGGGDCSNQTLLALRALLDSPLADAEIHVVFGSAYRFKDDLRAFCRGHARIICHEQISNMAQLLDKADLAIGAGGSTTWERCFLGLPTLTVITAANQAQTSIDVAELGAIELLGDDSKMTVEAYKAGIMSIIQDKKRLGQMSLIGSGLVESGASRVADLLVSD